MAEEAEEHSSAKIEALMKVLVHLEKKVKKNENKILTFTTFF